MPVTFDQGAEPGLIRLEGEVDISDAPELKRVLLEALAKKGEVRISAEAATGIDITAVQLLWAAEQEAGRADTILALQGTLPEMVRVSLREAGFERLPLAAGTEPSSEVQL